MHDHDDNHEPATHDGALTLPGPPGPEIDGTPSTPAGPRRRWFGRRDAVAALPAVEAPDDEADRADDDDDQDPPRPRWNARVGSAALLSFLILVGALVGNRLSGSKPGAAADQSEPPKARAGPGRTPSKPAARAAAPGAAIAESPPAGDVPDSPPPPARPGPRPSPPTLQVVASPVESAEDEPPAPAVESDRRPPGEVRRASIDGGPPEEPPDLPPEVPDMPAPAGAVAAVDDSPADEPPPPVVEPAPPLAPAEFDTSDDPPAEPPSVAVQPAPAVEPGPRRAEPRPDRQPGPRPIAAVPDFAPSTVEDDPDGRPSYPTEDERAHWIPIPTGGGRRRSPTAVAAGPEGEARPTTTARAGAGAGPATGGEPPIRAVPYVVRRGETFDSLARRYYGSSQFGRALWAANSRAVASPDDLTAGTTIRLPAFEDLDRSQTSSRPDALLALPAAEEVEQPSRRERQVKK